MSVKVLKNNTGSAVLINDVGITIPASGQYTIPPQEYLVWAGSTEVFDKINDNTLTVNDGTADLADYLGTALIKDNIAKFIGFDNSVNGFPASVEDVQSAIEQAAVFNPLLSPSTLYDDFDNRMGWSPATSGTGASASVSQGNATFVSGKHNGVARVATGTVLGTSAALNWSATLANSLMVGNGLAEYRSLIRLPILSSAPNNYIVRIGLGTSTTADHANGIYFEYNSTVSLNWLLKTAASNVRTTVTSSVAVVANSWIELKWICNSAGTLVTFYVNNVSVGTISTNIQTTTGNGYGGNFQISNPGNVLAEARELFIDYFYYRKVYTARD